MLVVWNALSLNLSASLRFAGCPVEKVHAANVAPDAVPAVVGDAPRVDSAAKCRGSPFRGLIEHNGGKIPSCAGLYCHDHGYADGTSQPSEVRKILLAQADEINCTDGRGESKSCAKSMPTSADNQGIGERDILGVAAAAKPTFELPLKVIANRARLQDHARSSKRSPCSLGRSDAHTTLPCPREKFKQRVLV